MQNANMSASERTRLLGARTLATYHAANPVKQEGGFSQTFASSMVAYRVAGQQAYVQQTAQKPVIEIPACCIAPVTNCVTLSSINATSPDYFQISWDPVPNAIYYTVTTNYSGSYTITYPDNTATTASVDWDWATTSIYNIDIIVTAYNECSSISSTISVASCFLAGSLVQMADGSTKVIEDVAIGDIVLGAFGEHNVVLALHRPLLGDNTMCRINDHSTTSHHPHISADRKFYCMHPAKVDQETYGREHLVVTTNGKERMMLHGLKPGRVQVLETGVHLKTVEGSREVQSLEVYTLPPETQLYNLVIGGSHTYHVDGYAVTGWPREDDFDYDAWRPI
jgi:hypothetical protein